MKLQLDTKNKTIKLEEQVNLDELYKILKKLLPNDEWKGFTLEVNTQVVWTNPIIVNPWMPVNPYPWYTPIYYNAPTLPHNSSGLGVDISYLDGYQLSEGIFNIEVQ